MRGIPVLVMALVAVGCSHEGGGSASSGAAAGWPAKWCQAQPGITREQLLGIMGSPTLSLPTQMSWSNDHYQFNAFLEDDGTVRQLDTNESSYTVAEKASEPCRSTRSRRGMLERAQAAQQAASPMNHPACELVPQEKMSAILGSPVTAVASGRDKCIYTAQGGKSTGVANPLDGIGDQAFAAGPALFVRTGDDLATIVLSGVSDRNTVAKKILDAAKSGAGGS